MWKFRFITTTHRLARRLKSATETRNLLKQVEERRLVRFSALRVSAAKFISRVRRREQFCFIAVMLGVVWLGAGLNSALAQTDGITLADTPTPTYAFGESITFAVSAQSATRIKSVNLFYRTLPDGRTNLAKPHFTPSELITATYQLSLTTAPLPAFTQIEYWWEIADSANHTLTTDKFTFRYDDNRFTWRTLTEAPITVYWYQGDTAFGQAALETALAGLKTANQDLQAPVPPAIDIYLYANSGDLQSAVKDTNRLWVGGHANPLLNVIVVAVTPDALESEINLGLMLPHELTHILVYQLTSAHYDRVPTWLNEGLAVLYQARPNPNAPALLKNAYDQNTLLNLESLCAPFPTDGGRAELAYVQSASLVRYIRDQYGASRLTALLKQYADGVSCEAGVQNVFRLSLAELEVEWLRDYVNVNPVGPRLSALGPWLVLAALILLMGGLFMLFTARRPSATP